MNAQDHGYVKFSVEEGVGTIIFYHPASNSLPGNILREIAATIRRCEANEDVKVMVLKSEGDRTFCAGASFDELLEIETLPAAVTFFSGFGEVINAIRESSKIVIGRVQGKAVGGGVGLAAAVDYCLASESASVRLSELAVGIGPFVVGPAVQRKIGLSAFSQMSLRPSEWFPAAWAKEKGLYMDIYPTIQQLDEAVHQLATTLASYSPEAMAHLKRIFWEGTEHWKELLPQRASVSGNLILSEYSRTFLEKFKKQ